MTEKPTRRETLIQIAAVAAVSGTLAPGPLQAQSYQPRSLSVEQYRLLTTLVDLIIPPSKTPGAAGAGVDRLIDEALADTPERRQTLQAGLEMLQGGGFAQMDAAAQVKLLTEYSEASGPRGAFFQMLKDMTIDGYYSTEIGLVEELGYQGNTYLREFPGCQHEEHH